MPENTPELVALRAENHALHLRAEAAEHERDNLRKRVEEAEAERDQLRAKLGPKGPKA